MKKLFLITILVIFPICLYSQEKNIPDIIAGIAEELAADESDPEAVSAFIERLQELSENPVKLNSPNEDEISRLFFLSDFQVKALIDYKQSSGIINSPFEIANIPGFDRQTAELMIPFITLDNNRDANSASARWKNILITNLTDKPGTSDTGSLGSSLKALCKYKFVAGSLSGGFTAEKDPGERFMTGKLPVPDFLSAYFAYTGKGLIRKIIIGDFSARFGQGTNINSGMRTALSLSAPGYMAARNEIKPYTSTDENNFFRGMAAELVSNRLTLSLFYSLNYLDATLNSSQSLSDDGIESFYLSGIHNTPMQLKKKDAVSDISYGINMSCNFSNIRVGMAMSKDRISLPVRPEKNDPENVFDFTGERNTLYTVYYNSLIKRILLYGELSSNDSFKYAFVQGLSFRPSDRLNINFLYRKWENGYFSFHGKAPGSSSARVSGDGMIGNFTFEAARHLFISAGCDLQHFPWLKYRSSGPTMAIRKEIRVRFLPSDKLTFEALYSYRLSMADNTEEAGIPDQTETITRSIRGTVHYSINDNLTLGTRCEKKIVTGTGSSGMLLSQDFNYRFTKIPVTLWFRYCLFNTEDWNSRLYAYENDLLYSFSIPALSGEGTRTYIMAKWEIRDLAEIRLKYGITSITDSYDNISNNDEVKFQFKIRF